MLIPNIGLGFSKTPARDLNQSIAVVGAGVAGLVAANRLNELGYEKITVFESENHVGGKLYTRHQPEGAHFDMGGIWLMRTYDTMRRLSRKFGKTLIPFSPDITIHSPELGSLDYHSYLKTRYPLPMAIKGAAQFAKLGALHCSMISEGLHRADPSLFETMTRFSESNGLERFTEVMRIFTVGSGYDYFENVPAAYLFRGYDVMTSMLVADSINARLGSALGTRYMVKGGYQTLLEAMAASLTDLKLSAPVKDLVPRASGRVTVVVEHEGKEIHQDFDSVLVSTAHPTAKDLLKGISGWEGNLPDQVTHIQYGVTAFRANGLRAGNTHFFVVNDYPDKIGKVNTILGIDAGSNSFIAYQILGRDSEHFDATAMQNFEDGVRSAGARDVQVLERKVWPYFYHVPVPRLQADSAIFQRMNAAQGSGNVFLIGAGSAGEFDLSERVAEQAERIVNRHF